MAQGLNKVFLIGNLGKDPEVKYSKGGNAVCTLRVACTERVKEGDEWKDHTEWIDVVTFGKTAENAGQYLAKGRSVHVEGGIRTRKWKDKDGNDRYSTEVVCRNLMFLGGKDGGGGSKPARPARSKPAGGGGDDYAGGDDFIDDDLPF